MALYGRVRRSSTGRAGRFLDFVGGSIGRMAGTGVATGLFMIVFGMTPAELVVWAFRNPPAFISAGWFKVGVLILGLAIIFGSLRFNIWSKKQNAIDSLAEDLSWAIHDLLNRSPRPSTEEQVSQWETDFNNWCGRVSSKLANRAFFTRADQLHFDRLGFVEPIRMSDQPKLNWLLSQLRLKFDRLREVISWSQQRTH